VQIEVRPGRPLVADDLAPVVIVEHGWGMDRTRFGEHHQVKLSSGCNFTEKDAGQLLETQRRPGSLRAPTRIEEMLRI